MAGELWDEVNIGKDSKEAVTMKFSVQLYKVNDDKIW